MKIIRGTALDISSEGKGVIKHNKDIIFVDGLFPKEKADVEILYTRAGVYFGKVKKLYSLSKDRIQPKCKICTACGGCQFQQLAYSAQLEYKTKRVKNAMTRIADVDTEVLPCIGMEDPYHYRNKIQVPFAKDRCGKVKYGFYKENTHIIVPTKQCMIEDKRAAPILWDIKLLLEEMKIPIYNEKSGKGILRHVLIRTSFHYPEVMVVLVTTILNFPGQRNFINSLVQKHPEITTIVANVNARKTNVVLGKLDKVLYGPGKIKDDILGLTFEISASSFFQVNPIQVEKLYSGVFNLINCSKKETLLDAYSRVGTIGLLAAKKAKKVISVESNKSAHKNAIGNAKRNNLKNIEFICDDASEYIAKCDEQIDVVIMDPPRSGSDKKFLSTLVNKQIKKIIYVSCNPETLARDVEYLSKHYDVTFIQPVDMFPMTSHVETIVLLQLRR